MFQLVQSYVLATGNLTPSAHKRSDFGWRSLLLGESRGKRKISAQRFAHQL